MMAPSCVVVVMVVLAAMMVMMVDAQVKMMGRGRRPQESPDPTTNVRRLLGGGRRVRSLEDERVASSVVVTDPTPLLLAEVLRELGGDALGPCHVLLYYDPKAASPDELASLRSALDAPIILVDVSKLKFPLITKVRRRVPLLDLLSHRPDNRCRLLVAWSSSNYQRGLLLMARAEPGVLGFRDILVLPVTDQRLDRFMPQLRRRILVKRLRSHRGRGRRDLSPARFLVEGACEVCPKYSLTRLGEWKYPGGWKWGGATTHGQGLSGGALTVSYTPSVPNIFPVDDGDGKLRLEGVELRLLQYAAQALNFSYRLVVPADGEWGRPLNGTWTGKVGEIVRGRADIAVGGLVYTEERASVTEYSILFHNELWGIVCPLSVRLPMWPFIMFPFRTDTAPSVFTVLVLLYVMTLVVPRGPRDPQLESVVRVVGVGVSIYLRLMACIYFWNIYYYLLKPKYEPPVDTSTALLQSNYDWGVVTGTTVTKVLGSSRNPAHRLLTGKAKPLISITEGFQRLREDGLCLLGVPKRYARATIAMRHTTECGEPGLQVTTEDLNSVLGGWVLPRGSPLIPHINSIIFRLQTFGLLEHWRREFHELLITRGPRDLPCLNPPLAALNILDLRLAVLLLFCGWGLAFLVFVGELFAYAIYSGGVKMVQINDDVQSVTSTPPSSGRRSSLRQWLRTLVSPIPSINISAKEASFRSQLNTILKEIWGFDLK
ncbi:uncharacterized protein LOC121872941 [Homarus americanus]|uniref:uncharacterized protein LOC121872941 n=1 Tax=Homarus americanus TaxID=6706 RepID=UPI001C455B21|nr:uncharacterized protein LOC121872941 [Homarus americanus]XP_042232015.1 uncharacterized protein LOC121872941 [Homarus americanus]XP_042232016.1 uncharacterized protein LOC121872941 [Homarus americanus]